VAHFWHDARRPKRSPPRISLTMPEAAFAPTLARGVWPAARQADYSLSEQAPDRNRGMSAGPQAKLTAPVLSTSAFAHDQ